MRKLLFLLFFIVFACEYSGKYLKTGDQYFKKGNYSLAIQEYHKAEKINPHNATVFLHRGKALERLGLFDSAAVDFQKNLTYNDKNAEAMGHLAWCWYSTTPPKREACRKQMKVALEIDPSLSELWYLWGRMHFHSNDLSKAEIALKKAISLEKNYSDAQGLLARVMERTQRLSAAAPLVAQVLKTDPKNAEATHVAASISRSKNLKDLARRQDERAHFLDPSFPAPTHLSNSETTLNTPIPPTESIVFYPVKPNPSGRNNPKEEAALPLLADFLASDSSITLDLPTDTTFEQVLLRMIDSALTDSSIWAEASIDSAEKFAILQQFQKDTLDKTLENDTSSQGELKTINLQHNRAATTKPIFDSLSLALFNDSTTLNLEKWIWIRHWIQNADYSVLNASLKSLKNQEFFTKKPGFSDLLLAVSHHRLGQNSLANHYFRKASRSVPISPRIFNKEKIPIDR